MSTHIGRVFTIRIELKSAILFYKEVCVVIFKSLGVIQAKEIVKSLSITKCIQFDTDSLTCLAIVFKQKYVLITFSNITLYFSLVIEYNISIL